MVNSPLCSVKKSRALVQRTAGDLIAADAAC